MKWLKSLFKPTNPPDKFNWPRAYQCEVDVLSVKVLELEKRLDRMDPLGLTKSKE